MEDEGGLLEVVVVEIESRGLILRDILEVESTALAEGNWQLQQEWEGVGCGQLGVTPNLRLPGGPIPQVLDGEVYPPSVEEAPVLMHYPRGIPPQSQMAVGQEVFGLLPGLMLYATLWLREHNRVCDLLKAEHPTWGDEQLFQTTRLILIGEDSRPALPCPGRSCPPS